MQITVLPKNKAAIWASVISVLFLVLIFFKIRGTLPVPSFILVPFGLAGFVAALLAVIKKDRSIFSIISILIGLFIIIWIAAEILFPH